MTYATIEDLDASVPADSVRDRIVSRCIDILLTGKSVRLVYPDGTSQMIHRSHRGELLFERSRP